MGLAFSSRSLRSGPLRRPLAGWQRVVAPAGGYSLIELLIVIAVVGILAMVATPSFTGLFASAGISSNANGLSATFDMARSEAIARNRLVVVCRTADVRATTPACSAAGVGGFAADDWAAGWIVFTKPETEAVPSVFDPVTDTLLRRVEAEGARSGQARAIILPTPAVAIVAWSSSGLRTLDPGSTAPAFLIDHRDPVIGMATPRARCVRLSVIGRARTGELAGGVCNAT